MAVKTRKTYRRPVRINELGLVFPSVRAAAEYVGGIDGNIYQQLSGVVRRYKGYTYSYVESPLQVKNRLGMSISMSDIYNDIIVHLNPRVLSDRTLYNLGVDRWIVTDHLIREALRLNQNVQILATRGGLWVEWKHNAA